MDGTSGGSFRGVICRGRAGRACGRLQCRADRPGYLSDSYANDALVQPESREVFKRILDQGWMDAIRTLHPDASMYTFWDYMRNRWPRDAGLRIDHLLLSPKAAERLVDAGVDRDVRGKEGASDHAPAWVMLRDSAMGRQGSGRSTSRGMRSTGMRSPQSAKGTRRPLLIIDGDSFAHRSYHALPKTILRSGGEPAGAILGFANFLWELNQLAGRLEELASTEPTAKHLNR